MQILAAPARKVSSAITVPFANVRTLLHFDARPFVDSSSYAVTIGGTGNAAEIETVSPLYGAGSLKTNGSTVIGATINSSGYVLSLANGFCIEAVVNIASFVSGAPAQILGCWLDGNNCFYLIVTSAGAIEFINRLSGVGQGIGTAAGTIALNTTCHIAAVVQPGGNQKLFVNGVDVSAPGNVPFTNTIRQTDSVGNPRFTVGFADNGSAGPFWYSSMRVDELRIVNGLPVYTGNFTPSLPHPNS